MDLMEYRDIIIKLAQNSIGYGIKNKNMLIVQRDDYPVALQEKKASFVTLTIAEQLRGCIGSLQAQRALFEDINYNAYATAFSDPRFMPLTANEFEKIHISVSILSNPAAMQFTSEQNLLEQLRPNIDGLIIQLGHHHATFLPTVWEQLPQPQQFLNHLKRKAQLPEKYWAQDIKVWHYTTQIIS